MQVFIHILEYPPSAFTKGRGLRKHGGMSGALFLSFEGSEGVGKSTQVHLLAGRLEALGGTVLKTREPGGTKVGETVRNLLQHSEEGRGMSPEAELLLFSASRAELVRKLILPALAAGTHVISDRFVDSTVVYQGEGRGLNPDAVGQVSAFATGGRLPDLTFVLDLPVEIALARLATRHSAAAFDRFEELPVAFFKRVRAGYLELAAREPNRISVIDAAQSPEAISEMIWSRVEARLNGC